VALRAGQAHGSVEARRDPPGRSASGRPALTTGPYDVSEHLRTRLPGLTSAHFHPGGCGSTCVWNSTRTSRSSA